VLTLIAYLTKLIAAWIAGRIYGYTRDEVMTMWGLSQAQAAVTLPTVIVGVNIGLFPESIFAGTMLMILATSITSPLLVQRFGKKVRAPQVTLSAARPNPFERVLVPVLDADEQEYLLELAGIMTREKSGVLMPLHITLTAAGKVIGKAHGERVMDDEMLNQPDTSCEPIHRVDTHVARGILHSALEREASVIVMGWRGKKRFAESIFGTTLDEVIWNAKTPVIIGRLKQRINSLQKVMLVLAKESVVDDYVDEMVENAAIIAHAINAPLLILTEPGYIPLVNRWIVELNIEHPHEVEPLQGDIIARITQGATNDTLAIISTTGSRQRFRSSLGAIPERIAERISGDLLVLHYPAPEAI
jgi:nucleotide-binding universal stress UspA family protein